MNIFLKHNSKWNIVLAFLILVIILSGCGCKKNPVMPSTKGGIFKEPDFIKGITYAGFDKDVFISQESDNAINNLFNTGANWVAIVIVWYQDTKNSNTISPDSNEIPSDESLDYLIDYIHNLGMKIMLKPHVDSRDGTWRAKFQPSSWDEWFASYTQFMVHYAKIASNKGVEVFSVGCEYTSSDSSQDQKWRETIAEIKRYYTGKLTYCANFNFGGAYKNVSFWNLLDYIGIDAYFEVTDKNDASVEEMKNGWQQWITEIENWRNSSNITKPVIFTEIGVCSYDGAAKNPWGYVNVTTSDWQEQADYYKAFFETFIDKEWLKGIFWWWWDNPSTADYINGGQTYQTSYTPQGKPAVEVLKEYFK